MFMLPSILIIGISLALLVYWFRYSCLLLLRARAEMLASTASHPDPRFGFAAVYEPLREESGLDALEVSLNRDYRVLIYLLDHAAGHSLNTIEDRMLVLDYRIMRWWFRLTRVAAPGQARHALSEMAMVLRVLVDKLGPQPDLPSQA
jgi:hypothetical protein